MLCIYIRIWGVHIPPQWGVDMHPQNHNRMGVVYSHPQFCPKMCKKPKKSLSHVCPEWEIY